MRIVFNVKGVGCGVRNVKGRVRILVCRACHVAYEV